MIFESKIILSYYKKSAVTKLLIYQHEDQQILFKEMAPSEKWAI